MIRDATVPVYQSEWTGTCTRLMQIQMVVLFFYSGISKMAGDDWRTDQEKCNGGERQGCEAQH